MRIAIIIPRLEELGPIKSVQALVNSLSKMEKVEIKVFYIDRNVDMAIVMAVPTERLQRRSFQFRDYDIIHTNGIRPDFFAFINHKKIRYHISTIRNFVFEDLSFSYNKIISWIFGNVWLILWRRADKLVCISETMKSYYEKWYPLSKLELIYNGLTETETLLNHDDDILKIIDGFRAKGLKVLGSAGILTRRKGIDQILNMLVEEDKYSLIIIGNGKELLNLQQMAKKLKIDDRCLFCGFKSNAIKYFRFFDCFVVPSRSEGFGRVLVEAVQQKVPVICSDIEVFRELFSTEEVTFFKLEDIKSLREALKLSEEEGNKKIGPAYDRYLNNYSDKLMARKYFNLYRTA
jgi:glycosyltransferase involved in cell wall biosynthesis